LKKAEKASKKALKRTRDNSQKREATSVQESTAMFCLRTVLYRIYVAELILLVLLVTLIRCVFSIYEGPAVEEPPTDKLNYEELALEMSDNLTDTGTPTISAELPSHPPPPAPKPPELVEEILDAIEAPVIKVPVFKEPPASKEPVAAIDQPAEEPYTKDSETFHHSDWWNLITKAMESTLVKEEKKKNKKAKKGKKSKKTSPPSSPTPPSPLELPTEHEAISLPSLPFKKRKEKKKDKGGKKASPPPQSSPLPPFTPPECEVISPPSLTINIPKEKKKSKKCKKGKKDKAPPPSLPPLLSLPELLAKYEAIEPPAESHFRQTRYNLRPRRL